MIRRASVLPILLFGMSSALGSGGPIVLDDFRNDVLLRRTDADNDGAVRAESVLPDLLRLEVGGWRPDDPVENPYVGRWEDDDDFDILRLNLVFNGVVNPPGPIGLGEPTFEPFRHGPSPLLGFVEINVDQSADSGGEIDGLLHRFTANVARFGGRPEGELHGRIAESLADIDDDLTTPPLVERSGEEWHLSLCGCQPISIVDRFGDESPETFDEGDMWLVQGRFLHRSHAISEYSFAFGGSRPGEYDPIVHLLFCHDSGSDETTVSFVYGHTQQGAGELDGQPAESTDLNAANQTSIKELLEEIRFAAVNSFDPGPGTSFDLLREWKDGRHKETDKFLTTDTWRFNAIFGTSYLERQPDAYYVWTDVGFDVMFGDVTGDGTLDDEDRDALSDFIRRIDGTGDDEDGTLNAQIPFFDHASDFSMFDLDYDGRVNSMDLFAIGLGRWGDVTGDGDIDEDDFLILRLLLGIERSDPAFNPAADLNRNGVIERRDRAIARRLSRLSISPAL